MNVHHKCQKKVANLCGINQKLLAEALTQVSQVCFVALCHAISCFESIFVFYFYFIYSLSLSLGMQVWH